jgi:hypothetical protein
VDDVVVVVVASLAVVVAAASDAGDGADGAASSPAYHQQESAAAVTAPEEVAVAVASSSPSSYSVAEVEGGWDDEMTAEASLLFLLFLPVAHTEKAARGSLSACQTTRTWEETVLRRGEVVEEIVDLDCWPAEEEVAAESDRQIHLGDDDSGHHVAAAAVDDSYSCCSLSRLCKGPEMCSLCVDDGGLCFERWDSFENNEN